MNHTTSVLSFGVLLLGCTTTGGHQDDDTGTLIEPRGLQRDVAADVCQRWSEDRAVRTEGTWTGSVDTCDPGDVVDGGREAGLLALNLMRWLARVPEVRTDAELDGKAQECALVMHANGNLSHSPDPSWACTTPDAVEAAGASNLATAGTVRAIDLYMTDLGISDLGHRRTLLAPGLEEVGIGSTVEFSCLWRSGGEAAPEIPWVAWPPPGPFPFEAMDTAGWASLDQAGWSIQTEALDLSGAQVQVRRDGVVLPVVVRAIGTSALVWTADGWASEAGAVYDVAIDVGEVRIAYAVDLLGCG